MRICLESSHVGFGSVSVMNGIHRLMWCEWNQHLPSL